MLVYASKVMQMNARTVAVLLVAVFTSTSTSALATAGGPTFDIHAFQQYQRIGTASIVGQLAVTLPDGTTAGMPGATVAAYPDSEYIRWWLDEDARAHARYLSSPDLDPDAARLARYAVTDNYGNFRIDGLPAGDFIVRGVMYVDFPLHVNVSRTYVIGERDGKPVTGIQNFEAIQTVRSTAYLVSNIARVTPHDVVAVSFWLTARTNRAIGAPQALEQQVPSFEGIPQ
jgi:hypothetical protein